MLHKQDSTQTCSYGWGFGVTGLVGQGTCDDLDDTPSKRLDHQEFSV